MNINDKSRVIIKLQEEVADYELDYQDMKREAKDYLKIRPILSPFVITIIKNFQKCMNCGNQKENRITLEKEHFQVETRLSQTLSGRENKLYNKNMESLEKEKL